MTQNRRHQSQSRLSRFFGWLLRFSPHRVLRHFKAVSHRLDSIMRFIEAESAARIEQGSRSAVLVQRQLATLEQRLSELVAMHVAAVANQLESTQKAHADELFSTIERNVDVVNELKDMIEQLKDMIEPSKDMIEELKTKIESWDLDRWDFREYAGLVRNLRRQEYLRAIREGRLAVPRLETDYPSAVFSNAIELPPGGKIDNAIALRFNRRLYELFGGRECLRVLDFGCAGGGFVRSLIDDGHFAVGLEGSDYARMNQSAEWSTIPMHLFTCDISKPFRLTDSVTNAPLLFDAITAWEVLEYIPAECLPGLFENLDRHLAPGGCALFSIVTFFDWDPQNGGVRGVTVKPRSWWENKFTSLGFEIDDQHPIGKDDWLRGSGQCRTDWHEEQGLGFHIVLRKKAISAASLNSRDAWRASVA
jgi:2-polyprenyl-3-methyl-5-hydroxy-6-metoxy-1,4-benzoquinol methylase